MALTRYLNLHLKRHFLAIYSMKKTSGHFNIFCPSGPTMVSIRAKLKVVKFYGNFSQYNFEKLIQPRTLIFFQSQMTLLRWLTFLFAYLTVTLIILFFCISFCNGFPFIVKFWSYCCLSFHWLSVKLRMPCFIT